MSARNIVALVLLVISFGLLVPGLTRDLITITANAGGFELFKDTRSIVQTIRNLHESGNDFVAGLIFLFGIVVPLVKGAILLAVLFIKNLPLRDRLFAFVRSISKWAMADVFVVGVYVAYLSAKATDGLDAEIHSGFYFFAAYCLVSLISLQFMKLEPAPGS